MARTRHEKIKLTLKICGGILIAGGIACAATGFADIIRASIAHEAPTLFWLLMIGLPALGFGLMALGLGFRRELSTYAKNEAVPVLNEAAPELAPAVRATAQALKEGLTEEPSPAAMIVCPACGASVTADNKFCTACGKPLTRTCPHCGIPAEEGAAFCGTCGKPLP